jgi:hypothetical protein
MEFAFPRASWDLSTFARWDRKEEKEDRRQGGVRGKILIA